MAAQPSRAIPGMPATAQQQAGKKKKSSDKPQQSGSPGRNVNGSHDAISKAALAATLSDKSPAHGKVDDSVKVQTADLAEQAELQSALAAVKIVEEKDGAAATNGHAAAGDDKLTGTALHQSIQKRIKVLNKKLQRAIAYSEKPEGDLNADMKRIIASKGNLEGAVAELTETLKAIEVSELEHSRQVSIERKILLIQAEESAVQQTQRTLKTLFQLSHLNTLIAASMQASFAPPALPDVLQMATSQQVAAIGKLSADLSAPADVNSADAKIALLNKLVSASTEEVLPGVAYKDILLIIEGLESATTQQMAAFEPSATAEKVDATPKDKVEDPAAHTEAKQNSPQILFMQASELEHSTDIAAQKPDVASGEAPEDTKPAEPEGGAINGVAMPPISGGSSVKGVNGANGTSVGAESTAGAAVQDGSAKSGVDEPVQTIEVAAVTPAPPATFASQAAAPAPAAKVIDWAANDDDDDFGDLEMQPEAPKVAPPAKVAENEAVAKSSQLRPNAGQQRDSAGKPPRSKVQQQSPAPAPAVTPKLAPQIDEDGFIVASSKRTKMQQQQQQQAQSQRGRGQGRGAYRGAASNGRGGGGSGGAAGGNGRGTGHFPSGTTPTGRGRGRGRGGAPLAPESA